jgi:hypothetical protein
MNVDTHTDGGTETAQSTEKKVLKEQKETIVDKQQLEWIQCVRDYSDGAEGGQSADAPHHKGA